MLFKRSDLDVIEQVRADPGVREVIELYRESSTAFAEGGNCWLQFKAKGRFWGRRAESKLYITKSEILSWVIQCIATVYEEVVGKSPRTWDGTDGKRIFDSVVMGVFEQEDLPPPTEYRIRQAIKLNKALKGDSDA